MSDVVTRCTDAASCAPMQFAFCNPPREGLGLVWQLVVNLKTGAQSHMAVYHMRRSRKKGDLVFKVPYCPFCGARLNEVPVDPDASQNAMREAIELTGAAK
jgi:hypothetical protein